MDSLDNPLNLPHPDEVSMRPTVQRYGLIGALVLIVFGLAFNLLGLVDFTDQGATGNIINQIVQYGVLIAVIAMAMNTHKNEDLGGYITYGRAFLVGLLTGVVMAVLAGIWTYLYFVFVDPELMEIIREASYEQALEQGTSEEDLEAAEGIMDFFVSPGFISSMAAIGLAFVSCIISLIAAAIIKREPPHLI